MEACIKEEKGDELGMPSNCIPWHGSQPSDRANSPPIPATPANFAWANSTFSLYSVQQWHFTHASPGRKNNLQPDDLSSCEQARRNSYSWQAPRLGELVVGHIVCYLDSGSILNPIGRFLLLARSWRPDSMQLQFCLRLLDLECFGKTWHGLSLRCASPFFSVSTFWRRELAV
jgi:hypothetical protein